MKTTRTQNLLAAGTACGSPTMSVRVLINRRDHGAQACHKQRDIDFVTGKL